MDKKIIKQIILRQQYFVSRVALQTRDIALDPSANYVLVGMRRAGKSYTLYQHIQQLIAQGHSKEEILFINFEDERITDIKKEELHLILEAYQKLFNHTPILFLDEIQNVDGWEHFARRLADEKYRVFITGSNAHMLSREISSTLGGRYLTKEITPFSLAEYLEYHNIQLEPHWTLSPQKAEVARLFPDYFYYGGLPEVFDIQDKQAWLLSLYQKILYSDIIIRKGVRNVSPKIGRQRHATDGHQTTAKHPARQRNENILGDDRQLYPLSAGSLFDVQYQQFQRLFLRARKHQEALFL